MAMALCVFYVILKISKSDCVGTQCLMMMVFMAVFVMAFVINYLMTVLIHRVVSSNTMDLEGVGEDPEISDSEFSKSEHSEEPGHVEHDGHDGGHGDGHDSSDSSDLVENFERSLRNVHGAHVTSQVSKVSKVTELSEVSEVSEVSRSEHVSNQEENMSPGHHENIQEVLVENVMETLENLKSFYGADHDPTDQTDNITPFSPNQVNSDEKTSFPGRRIKNGSDDGKNPDHGLQVELQRILSLPDDAFRDSISFTLNATGNVVGNHDDDRKSESSSRSWSDEADSVLTPKNTARQMKAGQHLKNEISLELPDDIQLDLDLEDAIDGLGDVGSLTVPKRLEDVAKDHSRTKTMSIRMDDVMDLVDNMSQHTDASLFTQ